MRTCISQGPPRVEIRSQTDAALANRGETVLPVQGVLDAVAVLRRHCRDRQAAAALRQLAGGPTGTGEEALRAVAAQLAAGRLILVACERMTSRAAATDGAADNNVVERERRPPVREPAPLPPPRRPSPVAAPAPEAELADDLAQDVQAAALEQAAADGTPFCEVCRAAAR